MKRFDGKLMLVTGGTSGIGLATAQRLRDEGARVVATGSRESSIERARETLGNSVTLLRNDAADPHAADVLAAEIAKLGAPLDGVFFNAGAGRFDPLEAVTAAEFDTQFAVNVRGPLLQAKALAPLVRDGGALLFNTSIARELGLAHLSIYASTKGALRTLSLVLAREFAPRQIRVNAVSPGPIVTSFLDRAGLPQQEIDAFGAQIESQVPLGRFGTPAEVAAVAVFLLSDEASFVTGAEYAVDGGLAQL